jgi:outer membrane protein TolC
VREALAKRIDYQLAVEALEEANRNINIAENNALPSLKAILSVTGNSRNTQVGGANGEALSLKYPAYNVGLQMSYPLWDEEIKTNLRNANLQKKQAEITAEELRLEIRDEVLDSIDQLELSYTILQNSRKAKTESESSYRKLIAKSRQGRFNSATVKTSFDALIEARHQELQALVNFNVSLLRLELAKNEIFEKYNVDVEKLIDEVR